jgi:hypothetical protein
MGTLPDTELQPIILREIILREIIEVDEKTRNFEADLRSADVQNKLLTE